MKQTDFQQLLQKYLDGKATPEEARLIDRWFEAIGKSPEELEAVEEAPLADKLWKAIDRKTAEPEEVRPGRIARQVKVVHWWQSGLLRAGVAAAVIVMLGTALLRYATPGKVAKPVVVSARDVAVPEAGRWVEVTNAQPQIRRVQLPDGSRVFLHPNTWLRYARQFTGARREVFLSGEAFFKVEHNSARPFVVYADKTVTSVLGTSFTIKAYPGEPQVVVAVKTGKVSVRVPDASPAGGEGQSKASDLVLTPHQQAVYLRPENQLKKKITSLPRPAPLQQAVFEEKPVPAVFTALAEAHGVELIYDRERLEECTLTVTFYNETLEEKLDLLCKILGASYEMVDKQVVIFSKGCR
jgi:ferric-dicitrate binding protein FerR (iron transport regulator)